MATAAYFIGMQIRMRREATRSDRSNLRKQWCQPARARHDWDANSPCQFELLLRSCVVGRRRAVGGCRFLADHGQPASYRSSVGLDAHLVSVWFPDEMPTFKSLYRKRANTLYSCRRIALRASDTTLILVVPYPQKPKRTCLASMFCGFREFRTRRRSKRDERNDAPQDRSTGDRRGWRPSRRKPQGLLYFSIDYFVINASLPR